MVDSNSEKLINKSFVFIPFRTGMEMKDFITKIEEADIWEPINEGEEKKYGNTRYLLEYVADRIGDKYEGSNMICVQKRINFNSKHKNEFTSFIGKEFASFNVIELDKINHYKKTGICKITDSYLFSFGTGVNFVVFEIRFEDSSWSCVSNGLYDIKKINQKSLVSTEIFLDDSFSDKNEEMKKKYNDNAYSLIYFVHLLFDKIATELNLNFSGYSTSSVLRANILSYVEASAISDDLELALYRLSNCYNDGYKFSQDDLASIDIKSNGDICNWGISTESVVCLAYPEGESGSFVRNVFRNNFSKGYLLTYALLLNQKYTLYEFLNMSHHIFDNDSKTQKKVALEYSKKFYIFEQSNNLKVVSEVPQYQNFYYWVYKRIHLDQLMTDVSEPLNAIKQITEEEFREREEKSDWKTEKMLTFISILAIFSALTDSWNYVKDLVEYLQGKNYSLFNIFPLIISLIIIIAFVVVLCVVNKKSKK